MNFGIVTRSNVHYGGDLVAIRSIAKGLEESGHRVFFGHDVHSVRKSDYTILTNSCLDIRHHIEPLKKAGRYGIFTFQEDFSKYYNSMMGFCSYVSIAFNEGKLVSNNQGIHMSIEALRTSPILTEEWGNALPERANPTIMLNRDILKDANNLFVHSDREKNYISERIPEAKPSVVRWAPGIVEGEHVENDDSFLKLTGLTKGEYTISVGRIEGRKNQLASIMAMYDSDLPMAFISSKVYNMQFVDHLMSIAAKRKGPTIIVSQDVAPMREGNLTVISTDGDLLENSVVRSAYENAGLHLHPAFYDFPGLTTLEAARYNIPQIASSWATIDEYLALGGDASLGGRVEYVAPNNLQQIEEGINKQFGRTFEPMPDHPALTRTARDSAREVLDLVL